MTSGAITNPEASYDSDETRLASCLAFISSKCPDLASVIDAWPELPEAIRAAILAMVQTATKPKGKPAHKKKE